MRLSQLWKSFNAEPQGERRLPEGQRIYAIGDIHGCDSHLVGLLDSIRLDVAAKPKAHVTLVYLGDYIDRGPHSAQVLSLVARSNPWANTTVRLKGNHEEMLERFLVEPAYGGAWRQFGGVPTLASYGVDVKAFQLGRDLDRAALELSRAIPEVHHNLIKSLPYSHIVGDYFFCHAGVRPGVALEQQQPSDLCWIRQEFLSSDADFGLIVVHGHTPVDAPDVWPNRVNVDTGAYATGILTCAVIEGAGMDFIAFETSDLPKS